jgi:hypothetical protein
VHRDIHDALRVGDIRPAQHGAKCGHLGLKGGDGAIGGEAAISGDLLSAVISIRYIFGFRKDNPNVFNSLIQSWPHL